MPAPMAVPNSASTQLQAGPSDLVAALLIRADPAHYRRCHLRGAWN